ncbi:MAG: hypothetical protein Q8M15_09350 [Bacteroidota bacterium]|nr:hypothetical protein [Bacteroidota bacterium]
MSKTNLIIVTLTIFILFIPLPCTAQEWKNLKSYRKETGNTILKEGCWLKRDRIKQSMVWKEANLYNFNLENGNLKYETVSQIRDFYLWFDNERVKMGHEIKWIGLAAIVAGQFSKLDCGFIRFFIVRNKEVVAFINVGSKKAFEFSFPQLKKVYFSSHILKGKEAKNWDSTYGKNEQCYILDTLFKNNSQCALNKLERMAKGKGIFIFGIPKALKYDGKIEDCEARFRHGTNKLLVYYLNKKSAKKSRGINSNTVH